MRTPRAILALFLPALLGLACACPAAGLLQRAEPPALSALPTFTRAARTLTRAPSITPSATRFALTTQPTSTVQPASSPVPSLPPAQSATQAPGEDVVLSAAQLVGRYQESWLVCETPLRDWREGLVFEISLSGEEELLVRELPDAGNTFDPAVYIPGFTLDFFVYGGEAHPDRFLYYAFDVLKADGLQGWLEEDAGGYCQVLWTRLP